MTEAVRALSALRLPLRSSTLRQPIPLFESPNASASAPVPNHPKSIASLSLSFHELQQLAQLEVQLPQAVSRSLSRSFASEVGANASKLSRDLSSTTSVSYSEQYTLPPASRPIQYKSTYFQTEHSSPKRGSRPSWSSWSGLRG